MPDETMWLLSRELLVGIKGPLTTPVGGGIRSLERCTRQDLYLLYLSGPPFPNGLKKEFLSPVK